MRYMFDCCMQLLIVKDGGWNHSMGSTMDIIINSQSRVIKGEEGWVVVSGCCGSVAEHWRLKPEALGLTPGSTTFLSFPLPFQGLRTVTAQIIFD